VPSPIQIAVSLGSKSLGSDGFQYISFLQPKEFDFKSWGKYFVINFLGTQWFAGYDSSMLDSKATKSLLEHDYLGKVLLDTETQGIVFAGNYTFQEGYEMRIRDVGNDSIFLQLLKNGVSVDNSVVKSNSTYIYKKDLGDVKDLPIIMVHLNSVFNNGTKRFATIDGIFQISDQYLLSIDQGLLIGDLEIISIQPNGISMVNDDYVDLNRDSTVSIGPGMNIRVADNDTLRYYLYTSAYVVPAPKPPLINKSGNVTSGAPENISMIVQAAEIRQVTADILDSSNKTVFSEDITPLGSGLGRSLDILLEMECYNSAAQ
jgi:S-layer-related duplication domain